MSARPRSSPRVSRKVTSALSKKTSGSSKLAAGEGKKKVPKHVDAKVKARQAALNMSGGVKVDVFVRVRPRLEMEATDALSVAVDTTESTIDLTSEEGQTTQFKYDKVYEVTNGVSCAIFAYGQTGSGKTHTMRGDMTNEMNHGVIQRSIEALFRRLKEKDYTDIKLKVSFLEIYNEELEDLFSPLSHIREADAKGGLKQRTGSKLRLIDHKTR
eukprot:gene9835-29974_t